MVDIAVQIVTHNHAETLAICLEHVLAAVGDFAVWLVDNASTDETVAIAQKYPITVIANADNRGYAAAQNQALRLSESPYVLTLNPDVLIQPDFIVELQATLAQNPQVGAAAGCLYRVDHLGETPQTLDGAGLFLRRNRRQGLHGENQPLTAHPPTKRFIFGPDGAAAFYRRAMLLDIACEGEIFDETFWLHKEDVDICWRAQWRGWQALYVPTAIAHHRRTFRAGQRAHLPAHIRAHAVRNRYLLFLKHESLRSMWRDVLPILFYEAQIWVYVLLFERRSFWAISSLWGLRHEIWRKRRLIQAGRRVSAAAMLFWLGREI